LGRIGEKILTSKEKYNPNSYRIPKSANHNLLGRCNRARVVVEAEAAVVY
jgi:hypothetical protein